MKPSFRRHPVAILREKCGLYQKEFADLIGCSRIYVQKIEQTPQHGGQRLSEKLAVRIFHETGVSLEWLLAGDTNAAPVAADGKEYTRDVFDRARANKIRYDQPHSFARKSTATGFCARLIAIMEAASADKNYYMCAYKTHKALESLRREFGQDEKLYSNTDIRVTDYGRAVPLLEQLIEQAKNIDLAMMKLDELDRQQTKQPKPQSKRPSKKKRHR